MSSRKPDYILSAFNKATEAKGRIGAAWANPDGSIRIALNYCTKLPENDPNLVLTLFPENETNTQPARSRSRKRQPASDTINDPIPG